MSFFHATRAGSISGSNVTRKHPFFTTGAVSALDTWGIVSMYSRINSLMVFPVATTLERASLQNNAAPANDIVCDFYQGGSGGSTGDQFTLTNADWDAAADLSSPGGIVCVTPTIAGEIDTTAIELEAVQTGFSTALIQTATKYTVPTNINLSWLMGGWVIALGSNAEEFCGINMNDVVTTESARQAPWARSGTLTTLMVLAIFQNGTNDKTYTFAIRNGGADVISVSTTNSASGGANIQLLTETATTPSVAAGDFLNWRVGMSGGFTAGRAVQFMAVLGFEDDN